MVSGYGQFCAVARALDVLGERWTLLIVRELLLGATTFTDIRRGLPRIPRATLFGAALTVFVETCQYGIVGRAGSITDIRNNTLGALLGAIAVLLVVRSIRPEKAADPGPAME